MSASRKYMSHQADAHQFIESHPGGALLAMDPGTGKTMVAIRTARLPCLIIPRRDDYMTWKLELEAEGYSADDMYFVESGDEVLPDPLEANKHPWQWFVISYDLAKQPGAVEWIAKYPFDQVIADECHYLAHMKSTRTKRIIKATRRIPYHLGMSGSIIGNKPLDLFSQCLFADGGRTFGDNEWMFKQKYYVKDPMGNGWYLRRDAKAEIPRKLANVCFYVAADDVMKLPPERKITKGVPFTGKQRRMYEQVLTNWEAEIRKGEIVEYDQVIVQMEKLKQIASGFIFDPDGKYIWLGSRKYDWVFKAADSPEELGMKQKIVVWGSHTPELEKLCAVASIRGEGYAPYYGKISRRQREESRVRFRDDPKCRWFFGQVDRGVGMNELIGADTAIYVSNSTKVISKQQSKRRIRRRGSEIHEFITYYELVTENSIDLALLKSLGTKMDLADMILRGIRRGTPLRKLIV